MVAGAICCCSHARSRAHVLQVALKRIPDVLSSPDLTRKVLREVCILRRLSHPFIISLRDAFLRPSSSGVCSLKALSCRHAHFLHQSAAEASFASAACCGTHTSDMQQMVILRTA